MSGAIILIVEDENDGEIVKALLKAQGLNVPVKIRPPFGKHGSISRLAEQIEELIATAVADKGPSDCIAVLHDADEKTQRDRKAYDRIRATCEQQVAVKLVIARDEVEAWLLADSGLCAWLKLQPANHDEQAKPSEQLNRYLDRKRLKFQGPHRAKVLEHLNGDGYEKSPSMKEARRHLQDAPCVKE